MTSVEPSLLFGGAVNDIFVADATDTLKIHSNSHAGSYITGTTAAEELIGTQGNDTIIGFSGDDTIYGGDGNDLLYAYGSSVSGGQGDAVIFGGRGDDSIIGGDGNDTLKGGEGNDHLQGGRGDDILAGESGRDTFVFIQSSGNDTIQDFQKGDVLLIQVATIPDPEYVLNHAKVVEGNTIIDLGTIGTITLLGYTNLDANDISLGLHW